MTLLCSLPADFDNLIVSLESRADYLTFDFVSSRLLHEEARRVEAQKVSDEETALVVRSNGVYGRNGRASNKGGIKCYRCQMRVHIARNCPERYQTAGQDEDVVEKANQAAVEEMEDDEFVLATTGDRKPGRDVWLIDSGASSHQSPNLEWFEDYRAIPERKVVLGDGRAVKAVGFGSVNLSKIVNGLEIYGVLPDVLHVPDLFCNLLSVSKMANDGLTVQFYGDECVIKASDGRVLGKAKGRCGVYYL